jgi:hypothetical protein
MRRLLLVLLLAVLVGTAVGLTWVRVSAANDGFVCPLTGEVLPCQKCCPLAGAQEGSSFICPLTGEELPCPKCCPLSPE